jgi:HTH-type transcriptional regulator/antitoxin HigA
MMSRMATVLANPVRMIERGAPHIIRNEEQLAAYTKELYRLTAEPHPTAAQLEAIELLTLLIERYEAENFKVPQATPAQVLRYLLDSHGLRQRDIAKDMGSESIVSEVLSGKRKLNATHIEALSRRFKVSPAVFFPVD